MRAWGIAAVLVAASALAGCLSTDDSSGDEVPEPEPFYEDDRFRLENITEEEQLPTLLEAPKWKLGEWWRVSLTDDFEGETYSGLRVVAGAEAGDYLVGMPTHDFSNGLMVLHVPGFGQVAKTNLSFEIHDCPFEPLQFPLEEGKDWYTRFECRNVHATVTEVTETTATVHLRTETENNAPPADDITLVYDSELREIVSFDAVGYASYDVVEHGYDFHFAHADLEGLVTVPHMHDVIFQHGRLGGVTWGTVPQTDVTDEVDVSSDYDRVSFVIILGSVIGLVTGQPDPPVGGYYSESATAPDGTRYSLSMLPTDAAGGPLMIEAYKHDKPNGVWNFEHIAAGPGIAMAEGIAYHVYDVELPSGHILPSVGEHQHGTENPHNATAPAGLSEAKGAVPHPDVAFPPGLKAFLLC